MKLQVQILNAFVHNNQGGNPAGVVLDADNLSIQNKLEIAAKVGLSETAFVSQSDIADFKLDFFTPTKQIAHCGHATVATFSYLKQLGKINSSNSSKETIDGIRKIKFEGDLAFMEQISPSYLKIDDHDEVLLSLGLTSSDLLSGQLPMVVNTGNSFMIIPLKERVTLKNLLPNHELINEISEKYDLIGYYAFCLDLDNTDAQTRMFAPFYGIEEESGTGMAAGPLACYLHDQLKMEKSEFTFIQGADMNDPSPSLIKVNLNLKDDRIKSLMAGGMGLLSTTKEITISN